MIKEEIKKAEEEFEKKFKDMLDLVETQTGYSERENIKSFLSDYTTALLQSVVEEAKERIKHEESLLHGTMDEAQYYKTQGHNKALIDFITHLKDIISQQEKHENL